MSYLKYLLLITIMLASLPFLHACSMPQQARHNLLCQAQDFESLAEFQKAEKAFQTILDANKSNADILDLAFLMDTASFYIRRQDYTKALIFSDKALSMCDKLYSPDDRLRRSIIYTKAAAYEGLKNYGNCIDIYNELLLLARKDPLAQGTESVLPLLKLGDIEFKRKDFKKALSFYYKATTGPYLPNPLYRLVNYRLGICSIALGRSAGAEAFLKNSLPPNHRSPGPPELFDQYAQLLKRNFKYGGASVVMEEKANWQDKRQKYLSWLSSRVAAPQRFNVMDDCTERDFRLFMEEVKNCPEFNKFMSREGNKE